MNKTESEAPLMMSSSMEEVENYHNYLWDKISPFVGKRIIEFGVGFGQYTRRMLAQGHHVLGIDLLAHFLQKLQETSDPAKCQVLKMDLNDPEPGRETCQNFKADTIVCMNVLEYIREDVRALKFMNDVTQPGGKLLLIVPALSSIYNSLDSDTGHVKRYQLPDLKIAVEQAGWQIRDIRYINLPGVLGWILAGFLSKNSKKSQEESALDTNSTNWLFKIYDLVFVNISKLIDPVFRKIAGLSLVVIAEKKI